MSLWTWKNFTHSIIYLLLARRVKETPSNPWSEGSTSEFLQQHRCSSCEKNTFNKAWASWLPHCHFRSTWLPSSESPPSPCWDWNFRSSACVSADDCNSQYWWCRWRNESTHFWPFAYRVAKYRKSRLPCKGEHQSVRCLQHEPHNNSIYIYWRYEAVFAVEWRAGKKKQWQQINGKKRLLVRMGLQFLHVLRPVGEIVKRFTLGLLHRGTCQFQVKP